MPRFLKFLVFITLVFKAHVAATTCFHSGIHPRLNEDDCITAWGRIFTPVLRQGSASDWGRIQRFTRDHGGNPSARQTAMSGHCIVTVGSSRDSPTLHTSWHMLSKGILDLMYECVGSIFHGYGGTHEENGLIFLIAHTNVYDYLHGEAQK